MVIRGLTVLLIEDSETEQELITECFEASNQGGVSVLVADRLLEAMLILQDKLVDIIVLDLGLPDSSGLETLTEILAVADEIPVIVLTEKDDKAFGNEVISHGAQDFLAKGMEFLLPRICYCTFQRHYLQKKVQEAQNFLRNIIDSLTENIAITDNKGTILLVNKRWKDFATKAGIEADQTGVGHNYFKMCQALHGGQSELLETFAKKTQQVLDGQLPFFELEYPCPNQHNAAWYRVSVSPFVGMGEECLVIAHNEITEKKRIEIALKRSEAFLRLIFDTTPNCVFVKDDTGRYIMANRAIARLYGLELADMIGKTDDELWGGDPSRRELGHLFSFEDEGVVLQGDNRHIVEESFVDNNGKKHWFRIVKTPINFPDQPGYQLAIASEITSERADKEKIKDSELLLRTILDAMHYNLMLLDTDLNVVWSNKAAADCMKEENSVIGNRCLNLRLVKESCNSCNAKLALESGEKVTGTYRMADKRNWRITGCPIVNERGEIHNVLCIAEDISKWTSLEQQLRQAQKMEALGTLAGGIAHDFNNILTAILGFTELSIQQINERSSMDELSYDLNEVHRASIRAKDLVNQILTFSRKIDVEIQPLDMALIIKEALKLLRSTLPSSIQLTTNIPVNLGKIMADPIQIHQIVMNLSTNASHAIGENSGELSVFLRRKRLEPGDVANFTHLDPGDYLLLEVTDTGCGISESNLHTIFEPYFTTKQQGEGTGLGLSVVHGIVNDMGGEIQVRSRLGEGTSFFIYFPVNEEDDGKDEKDEPDSVMLKGNGERILLVDDEPMILNVCTSMLSKAGYQVESEHDPRDALERFQHDDAGFSLVISDITMPYMTGDKLVSEMGKIYPGLPVILMSGQPKEREGLPRELMGENMLKKPFTKKHLLKTVWRALHKKGEDRLVPAEENP